MKAFTLIELIIVVALLMLMGSVAAMSGGSTLLENNLETDKRMLVSDLRKAQAYAMAKKNNLTWGVCLTGSTIRFFGGSCGSPTISDDYVLSKSTVISGLSTVTFSNLRGEPSSVQSITLTGNNKTVTVGVNSVGGLTIN